MSRMKIENLVVSLFLILAGCTKSDARRTTLTSPDGVYDVIVDDYSEGTALYVVQRGKKITKYSEFMNWSDCKDVSLAWLKNDTLLISYDKIYSHYFISSGLEGNRQFRPSLCDRRFNKCDTGMKIIYKFDRCIYPY